MKQLINRTLLIISVLFLAVGSAMADAPNYKISKWHPNDGGIFTSISADGKWGVINLGMSGGDKTIKCPSRLYDIDNDKDYTLTFMGHDVHISAVSNVDAEGFITIAGSMSGKAITCKYDTNTNTVSALKGYDLDPRCKASSLTAITPDGKYAVGVQSNQSDTDEDIESAIYMTLFIDIDNGKTIPTPGLPERNLAGSDEHAIKFTGITPDARYIVGEKDWYIMQPNCPLTFLYDTVEHTYKVIGFTGTPGHYLGITDGLHHIEEAVLSPNGKYMTGSAYVAHEQEGTMFYNEYHTPFFYNLETGSFINFDDNDSQNIIGRACDNQGNIYGSPENGSPLRNFKIFYKQKYWIPFTQICQQIYGFNFSQKTGFEFSGTPLGVSGDGHRFVAFSDPSEAESYAFDFGAPFETIADGIDLLSNYTATPESGSIFSRLQTVEINFGRSVQILGRGNTHVHLYKGNKKIADGLNTTGANGGISMKQNSKTTVLFRMFPQILEDGSDYTLVIDAGTVALANDETMTSREIRIAYKGRKDGPVQVISSAPADGSKLSQLNSSTSYILLDFDCPVLLSDNYDAYVERLEEGGTKTRVATLSLAPGNTSETKKQLLLYPTSAIYLYDGLNYKVTLAPGSVSDYSTIDSENNVSFNEEWSMTIAGSYIREIANETTLFSDNFNDPNASQAKWLLYDGDKKESMYEMKDWGFTTTDATPWIFVTHDSEESSDYYATSHSLYTQSGQSDDWMMTTQLAMPADGKAILSFDAQRYRINKDDHLKIYVIPEDHNVSYLNDNNMARLREEAVLLDDILPPSGDSEEKTEGEWQHYTYSLSDYAGKNVYIAFVNDNNNKSAVFVDNVVVEKEIVYTIGFSNEERVVNKPNINIAGNFTIKTKEFKSGAVTLILRNAGGDEVSRIEWPAVSGAVINRALPFSFANPLPLVNGKENKYSIDIVFNGKDVNDKDYQRTETFQSAILNLAFAPTKRVVLEEMTGITCPNCPQGIIAIEACERQYKDQFIPVSIHSYDGDDLGAQFRPYTSFLGLSGAPSARINRIVPNAANSGIFAPMCRIGSTYYYDNAEMELWYNIVAAELDKLATCDVNVSAHYTSDQQQIKVNADVKYALDTEQQLSVFLLVLEDGIESYQENNFCQTESEALGEWGLGGNFGDYYAFPVIHNDVVRAAVGQTFAGTIGLLPQQFEASKVYTAELGANTPDAIDNKDNVNVVVMLIDTQSGEIVNAAKAHVTPDTGIADIVSDVNANDAVYSISGMRINGSLPAGIYIKGGKKQVSLRSKL